MQKKSTKRTTKKTARKRGAPEPEDYTDSDGNEVLDLIAVSNNHKRGAKQVLNLLDSQVIPLWLLEAIDDAINEAARRKRVKGWGARAQVEVLTALFEAAPQGTFTLRLSEREQLARHIIAIYRNPLTPVTLYNLIADFVTEGTGMKISASRASDDSLVDNTGDITLVADWTWTPRTIERIVDAYNTYGGHSEEVSHAN